MVNTIRNVFIRALVDLKQDVFSNLILALAYRTLMFLIPLLTFFIDILFRLTAKKTYLFETLFPNVITETVVFEYLRNYILTQTNYMSMVSLLLAVILLIRLLFSIQNGMAIAFDQTIQKRRTIGIAIILSPIVIVSVVLIEWGLGTLDLLRSILANWLPFSLNIGVTSHFSIIWKLSSMFCIYTLFLMLIYGFMIRRPCRNLIMAARVSICTSGLYVLSHVLFNMLMQLSIVSGTLYGAFGGLFLILLWIYISITIFVLGARILYYLEKPTSS